MSLSRVRAALSWFSPKFYFFMVVAVKIVYVKMFFFVMPTSSLEGLAILYGLLFVVGMLRLPEPYRQEGATEVIIWVLAIVFVLGLDWLIIYLTTPYLPNIAV